MKKLLPYFACVIALIAMTANAFGQDISGIGYGKLNGDKEFVSFQLSRRLDGIERIDRF